MLHARRDREDVRRELGQLGEVVELSGSDLLLLRLNKGSASAKAAWERIRKKLGEGESVQPVLLDESGSPQYPTGEVVIRFREAPSAARLKEFAEAHGLRLRGRNEYVPQQAIFELSEEAGSYLPKVVEEVAGEEDVERAWANTLAHFERL